MPKIKMPSARKIQIFLLCSVYCFIILAVSFCGFISSVSALPDVGTSNEVTPEQAAAIAATTYCQKYSDDDKGHKLSPRETCKTGYTTSYKGKEIDWTITCKDAIDVQNGQSIPPKTGDSCIAGFKQGARDYISNNPQSPSATEVKAAAETYCERQNYSKSNKQDGVSVFDACVIGYGVSYQGKEVDWDVTCKKFKFSTGTSHRDSPNSRACIAGFKQGARDYILFAGPNPPNRPGAADATAAANATETPGSNTDCDTLDGGPLQWILCPIINLGANGTDYIFNQMIKPLLTDVPVGNSPEDRGYQAWQSFRVLGNVFLVGCLLAIVFAQVRTPK